MKIIFICSSLEPGRDGVGDYTRQLASELIRNGHHVVAIALNDRHIGTKFIGDQKVDSISLQVLRLPTSLSIQLRFNQAKEFVNDFNPQWISLQFVPFGFHEKGLPFGLSRLLKPLGEGRIWHIMFHELWVGMDAEASMKHISWGWLQRLLIQSLLINLKPKIVHTQTLLYQLQLTKIGIEAEYLPLFGNIPLVQAINIDAISKYEFVNNDIPLIFVLFGSIHPSIPIKEFAKEVAEYSSKHNVNAKLILIGRSGPEQQHWVSAWKSVGLQVEVLGEQLPGSVSEVLTTASVGIATTPLFLIEKSSSVATMREHGLPILCVSRPWYPRGLADMTKPDGFWEYQVGHLESILSRKLPISTGNSVPEVARQFIERLSVVS